MDRQEVAKRVRQGAKLLDLKRPGWARVINLQRLETRDCWVCVLGQLYGHYDSGLYRLFDGEGSARIAQAVAHGFTFAGDGTGARRLEEAWLDQAWEAEILRRTPGRVAEVQHGSN